MKKNNNLGIIAIVASIMGAMVLSSCNHDKYYYDEEKAEQDVNEKYAVAFENAFGISQV